MCRERWLRGWRWPWPCWWPSPRRWRGRRTAHPEGHSFRPQLEPGHQLLVPPGARFRLRLRRPEGRQAGSRRDDGDAKVKTITGIRAAVINDRLFLNGRLAERTTDWYAQDKRGTVVPGEKTAELDAHGKVTVTGGSFLNGRDGANGGIFMPANPASASPSSRSRSRARPRTVSGSSTWRRPSPRRPSHPSSRC